MKQILTLLLLLCSLSVSAQDIIVRKNGTPIKCRIVEETKDEIVYKKWEDLEGDNYVMNREDALSVTYDENVAPITIDSDPSDPTAIEDPMVRVNDDYLKMLDAQRHPFLLRQNSYELRLKTLKWTAIGTAIATPVFLGLSFTGNKNADMIFGCSYMATGVIAITTGIWYGCLKHKVNRNIYSASLYEQGYTFKNGTRFSASTDLLRDNHTNNTGIGIGFHYNF